MYCTPSHARRAGAGVLLAVAHLSEPRSPHGAVSPPFLPSTGCVSALAPKSTKRQAAPKCFSSMIPLRILVRQTRFLDGRRW